MRTLERNVSFTAKYINTIHSWEYGRQQLSLKSLSLTPAQICKQDRHGLNRFFDFC